MAFQLRPDESIADGLRRLAKKELASACEQLERSQSPSEEAIHEARKSVKKVRALVHIVKTDNAHGLSRARKRLRTANRALSRLRDADAMNEALSKLGDERPRLLSEHTTARLRRQLSTHKDSVAKASARCQPWKDVAVALRDVRAGVKRWSPAHRRFRAIAPGLRMTHKSGRKALVRAIKRRRAADFHEWRKQIKALWYELRLIEDAGQTIPRDIRALHEAETMLGDDHNVVVLCAYLSSTHSSAYDPNELQRLWKGAEQYQQKFRRQAIARARAIYNAKTGAYARRIKRAWKTWDRHNRARGASEQSRKRA